ncbi:hypothetical protein Salat_0922400 [Sesamum alatum]|uniref:Uncharacterized protein n=1 Tax=Sesamum alatum TaxID=300844 RepID=A0AAE1YKE3_9LAMI|nr:hypothetical protein Salat_0922400 [Sesamum alatum]
MVSIDSSSENLLPHTPTSTNRTAFVRPPCLSDHDVHPLNVLPVDRSYDLFSRIRQMGPHQIQQRPRDRKLMHAVDVLLLMCLRRKQLDLIWICVRPARGSGSHDPFCSFRQCRLHKFNYYKNCNLGI